MTTRSAVHMVGAHPGPSSPGALTAMPFDAALIQDQLVPLASALAGAARLTPAERAEVIRIAQGFACKDSAAAANVSPETIRARRKRIYRKLEVAGSSEVLAKLLGRSLAMLGNEEVRGPGAAMSAATSSGAAM